MIGVLLTVAVLTGPVNAAEPADWPSLNFSTKPADQRLVAEIKKMEWWQACVAWGREERQKIRNRRGDALFWYLDAEQLLNGKDRGHVSTRTIDIGMTECGVFASKGTPEAVNQTTTALGRSAQFVYRDPRTYVYTEPSPTLSIGVVRAIQH